MRRATTFALGAVCGALGATALGLVLRGTSSGGLAGPETRPSAVAPTSDARLDPRPEAVPRTAQPVGEAEAFERWYVASTARLPEPGRARRLFWLGLVRAYAAAPSDVDLQRACDRALEAGVAPAELLRTLQEAGRGPSLKGLLDRHPDAAWDLRSRLEATGADDPAPLIHGLHALRDVYVANREGLPRLAPDPNEPDATTLLQRLAAIDLGLAIAEAEAIAAACPGNPSLLEELARGLAVDAGAALRFVRRGLEDDPLHPDLLDLLMNLDLGAATAHLGTVLARDPATAAAWAWLAEARERAGDLRGAAEALVRAAELDPSPARLRDLAERDPAAALPLLDAVTQGAGAADPEIWGLRTSVELRCGTTAGAFDAWIRVLSLAPGYASQESWLPLLSLDPRRAADVMAASAGRAFASADDEFLTVYARALVEARDARAFEVCRRTADKGIWWGGLPVLLARSDPAAALPLLEARRAATPADLDLLLGLAEAYHGASRRAEAAAAADRAFTLATSQDSSSHELFVTLARLDPEAGLARARERAARMDRAEGASLLGDVFAAMGRTEEARAAYDQAVRLDPANVRWRAARSALR